MMITENKVLRFFENIIFDILGPAILIVAGFIATIKYLPSLSETSQGNGAFLGLKVVIVSIISIIIVKFLKGVFLKTFQKLSIQAANMFFIFAEFFALIFFINTIGWIFTDGFMTIMLIILPIPFLIELYILCKKREEKQILIVALCITLIMTINIILSLIMSGHFLGYFSLPEFALKNSYMIIKNIQFLPLILVWLFLKKKNGIASVISAVFAILVVALEFVIFIVYDFADIVKGSYKTWEMIISYQQQILFLSIVVCLAFLIISAFHTKTIEIFKVFCWFPIALALLYNIVAIIFCQRSFDPFVLLIVVVFSGLLMSPTPEFEKSKAAVSTDQ